MKEERIGDCVCQTCGVFYSVAPYRIPKTKYCSPACRSSAIAKEHLNNGPKPWASANLDGHRHKSSSRFKKGHRPWNKGVKGLRISPDTEFQPGRDNGRALPYGSVTIRCDKSSNSRAWVKTSDGWLPRAQAVYIAKHGAIPDGTVVHHRDGDTLNDRAENLVALTPAEHILEHHEELRESRRSTPEQEAMDL